MLEQSIFKCKILFLLQLYNHLKTVLIICWSNCYNSNKKFKIKIQNRLLHYMRLRRIPAI